MVISKIEDGMVAELAKLKPITQDQPLTVDWLLADRKVNPSNLGKLVHAMQLEHAEQAAQPSALKLLSFHGKDTVTFDVVDQNPAADGTYTPYARVALEKDSAGKWSLSRFDTTADPGGHDDLASPVYVEMMPIIKDALKRKEDVQTEKDATRFAALFLTGIAKGNSMWEALVDADLNSNIHKMLSAAANVQASGKGITLQKSHDGRIPGTFEFHSGGENKADNRVSVAPIQKFTRS